MNPVERKNNLLNQLRTKELDMPAFLYQCALWGMDLSCFVEYEVRHYPPAPKEWQEYEVLPLDKRIKIPPEFFQQMSIKEYLAMRGKVYAYNWSDYCWLKEIKFLLPDDAEHLKYITQIDEKLVEFGYFFKKTTAEVSRIADIFEGSEI